MNSHATHIEPMRSSWVCALLACVSLSACSADYPVKAVFISDKLSFVGAGDDWFFGESGFCPSYFSVRASSGETIWRIESDVSPVDCKLFPITYGVTPKGWRTAVAAGTLKSGELYIINGAGGDRYHGAFRYSERRVLSVDNEPETARDFKEPPYSWPDELIQADKK